MSKTLELRKQLQIIFENINSNVHYEIAPDTSPYPYLVYELSELTYNYGKAVMQLEVNILDYGTSTSVVETLSDTLQDTLHKLYFINDKIQYSVYRRNRNTVQEEDKKIKRRRLTFEIQLYESKEE